jgi:catechol 2,3-dioxygenase-like lactoylglutathione lyase family enzyme
MKEILMLKNIRHMGRPVYNLDRALKFYRDLLGMRIVSKGTLDRYDSLKLLGLIDCELTWVKLATEDLTSILELYYFENEFVRETYFNIENEEDIISFDHISFTVENAIKLHELLTENNIEVMSAPSIDSECKHTLFFARDPDGNLIELVQVI